MVRQEVFDKVWGVLLARGFTRGGEYRDATPESFVCLYRSSNGPCAAGIFIEDEEYNPVLEGKDIICFQGKVKFFTGLIDNEIDFLRRLQRIHDKGNTPGKMKESLENFAKDYNLTIPEPVQ
jgi:hypothetical protein